MSNEDGGSDGIPKAVSENSDELQPQVFEDIIEDVEKIKIGRKLVDFRLNDPIFKVTEPVQAIKDETNCVFCDKKFEAGDRAKENCQFCGHLACQRCCHKQRNFAAKLG